MTQITAGESSEESRSRLELYGVYESEDALQKEMEKYDIETARIDEVEQSAFADEEDDFLSSPYAGSATTGIDTASDANNSNNIATRQQTSADRDIWGRFALKEAKDPILCPACTRPINTNRFALHLDKCMGIGTTVRSASGALGTSGTRSTNSTSK